jgi:hypothetical protein
MLIQPDALYTEAETAQILRVSKSFLAKARLTGDGPRYIKIGRAVRYPGAGLIDFQKSCTRFSTSEYFKRPKTRANDEKAGDTDEKKTRAEALGPEG